MPAAIVSLWFERTLTAALRTADHDLRSALPDLPYAILPSTMNRRDRVAEELLAVLPGGTVMTPATGAEARRALVTPLVFGRWRDVMITTSGGQPDSVLLPRELTMANTRVIACDVVEVARKGPFALDLPSRYLHPRHRMRLLMADDRAARAVEIAAALPPRESLIVLTLPLGTLMAVTADLIAAELIALALSEICLGTSGELNQPWEDAVVQRATELQIGATARSDIRLERHGSGRDSAWADQLTAHLQRRVL